MSSLKLCSIVLIVVMIICHHNKAWNMLIRSAFSVLYRHIHPFFSINCCYYDVWAFLKSCSEKRIYFSLGSICVLLPPITCFAPPVTEGQPYFFFFEFVPACLPAWAKAHQQASLSASTTIHHQAGVREGGWVGGVRQGASNGSECAPHPSFSSPQAAENTGLCHRQQPHSSLITSTMGLEIYSGEPRPAPFSCSLAPSPLSLAPPIQLLFSLLVTLFPWLFSLPLFPSALVPLLSPPHWGIILPTLFH